MASITSILVIEDDRFIGEMYVRSLLKEGYTVDWVVSGTQGYAAATSKSYDLILLDIMLPEAQGSDVLNKLRNDSGDKIPGSKVIILTIEAIGTLRPGLFIHSTLRVSRSTMKPVLAPALRGRLARLPSTAVERSKSLPKLGFSLGLR